MGVWENLPVLVALLLAMAAALVSSDTEARQEVTRFIADALKPQAVELAAIPVTVQDNE
jgi:hypothetical protein